MDPDLWLQLLCSIYSIFCTGMQSVSGCILCHQLTNLTYTSIHRPAGCHTQVCVPVLKLKHCMCSSTVVVMALFETRCGANGRLTQLCTRWLMIQMWVPPRQAIPRVQMCAQSQMAQSHKSCCWSCHRPCQVQSQQTQKYPLPRRRCKKANSDTTELTRPCVSSRPGWLGCAEPKRGGAACHT